jgi:hypothetical protein
MSEDMEIGGHHIDKKKALIIGGAGLAVVLGIMSARKKTSGSTTTAAADTTSADTPNLIGLPTSGSGVSPVVVTSPTPITVPVPVVTTTPTPIATSIPVVTPGGSGSSAPVAQPIVVPSSASSANPVAAAAVLPFPSVGLGNGGANYNTSSPAVQAQIASNEQRLQSDPAYVLSEKERAYDVVKNRQAVSEDTGAQISYIQHLDTIKVPQNAANSNLTPSLGFGGADYNTSNKDIQLGILANEDKLRSDPVFLASEISRALTVENNRQSLGLSTVEQQQYLQHLHAIQSGASTPSSLGATTTKVISPNPSPQPSSPAPQQITHANPYQSAQTERNFYTDTQSTTYANGTSSGVNAEGHAIQITPTAGNTITQDQYKVLAAQVAQGGSAADAALKQLSGKVVV